jgi:hypothetical protein
MKEQRPITRQKAAEISGLSVRTIDRAIALGELPARKFKRAIRIDGEGFRKWLQLAEANITTTPVHTRTSVGVHLRRVDKKTCA